MGVSAGKHSENLAWAAVRFCRPVDVVLAKQSADAQDHAKLASAKAHAFAAHGAQGFAGGSAKRGARASGAAATLRAGYNLQSRGADARL